MAILDESFPYLDVSRLARVESYRKNIYRPPYYIHKWWARRAGTTFRALLLSLLLEDSRDLMSEFYLAHDFGDRVILDPFMGGGTTVGEALRLGCRVVGSDLNPVAWFLSRKAMEAVDVSMLDAAMVDLDMTVGPTIRDLYSTDCKLCGGEAESIYTYWVKEIDCATCGNSVDLRTSRILAQYAQNKSRGLVSCPHCADLALVEGLGETIVDCPTCQRGFDPHTASSRAGSYHCSICSGEGAIVEALRGQDGPPRHVMVGMFYTCALDGRGYQGPSDLDLKRFKEIESRAVDDWSDLLIPRSEIPSGYNTDQAIRYNYRRWSDMFNARQLLALSALFSGIQDLRDESTKEFMVLLASSILEFNSMFAAAKGLGTGAVRHVFANHAFVPQKEPLEANVWSSVRSSGSFRTLFEERLKRGKAWGSHPMERRFDSAGDVEKVEIPGEQLKARLVDDWDHLERSQDALLLSLPSAALPLPDGSVDAVVTDPPYFDNVMYSELADYFYVWLRLVLADKHPQFRPTHVEHASEVIRNPSHGKDALFYENGLRQVFLECGRVLKPLGRLVFTFHHGSPDAWLALRDALLGAAFSVETFYPLHSEMDVGVPIQGKSKAIRFDVVLVCRRRTEALQLVSDTRSYVERVLVGLRSKFDLTPSEVTVIQEAAGLIEATNPTLQEATVPSV